MTFISAKDIYLYKCVWLVFLEPVELVFCIRFLRFEHVEHL